MMIRMGPKRSILLYNLDLFSFLLNPNTGPTSIFRILKVFCLPLILSLSQQQRA